MKTYHLTWMILAALVFILAVQVDILMTVKNQNKLQCIKSDNVLYTIPIQHREMATKWGL